MITKKRGMGGQVATEYLVIVGIALAFVIPITYVYFKSSGEGTDSVLLNKVDSLADDLSMAVNTVYSYGEDSETVILVKIPNAVKEIKFYGREVVFKVKMSNDNMIEIVKVVAANMVDCCFKPTPGTHKIGIKKIYNEVFGGELINFEIDNAACANVCE
ncbi:MAG: hypothetical protein KKG60_00480 [Nanoarchaeota archaeon]|nr:hypothetical protein [Nanoarchaeota archaeon]